MPKATKPAGRPTAWKNEFYLQSYQLSKEGYSNRKIAQALGISEPTFNKRLKKDKALKDALDKGRNGSENPVGTMKEYILGRLDRKALMLWDEIMQADKANASALVDKDWTMRKVSKLPKRRQQHLFIHAWVAFNFSRSKACMTTGISPERVKAWTKFDATFARLVDEVAAAKKDFFESALIQQAKEGNSAAIIFGCKTLNSDRYGAPNRNVKVTVDGQVKQDVSVTHEVINKLPLEVRTTVLAALRQAKEPRKAELEEVKDV